MAFDRSRLIATGGGQGAVTSMLVHVQPGLLRHHAPAARRIDARSGFVNCAGLIQRPSRRCRGCYAIESSSGGDVAWAACAVENGAAQRGNDAPRQRLPPAAVPQCRPDGTQPMRPCHHAGGDANWNGAVSPGLNTWSRSFPARGRNRRNIGFHGVRPASPPPNQSGLHPSSPRMGMPSLSPRCPTAMSDRAVRPRCPSWPPGRADGAPPPYRRNPGAGGQVQDAIVA